MRPYKRLREWLWRVHVACACVCMLVCVLPHTDKLLHLLATVHASIDQMRVLVPVGALRPDFAKTLTMFSVMWSRRNVA